MSLKNNDEDADKHEDEAAVADADAGEQQGE